MEKQFIISQSLVSAIVAYLQTKPYQEVAQAIPALLNLKQIKADQDDTTKSTSVPQDA